VTGLVIRIVAALIRDERGLVLLVRKRGTVAFMQPGGKYEPGESAPVALARELNEELGLVVDPDGFRHIGYFEADAANEAGHTVEAEVFEVVIDGPVAPLAEIEELLWIDPANTGTTIVAPLTLDHIFPAL
jgi:8-oxo-dGTP pyrophosphatase MutT (NUDIX family)